MFSLLIFSRLLAKDLRPDLSAYDVDFMHTPNIQKLADTGTTFTRAYCQEAVCSVSPLPSFIARAKLIARTNLA